MLAQFLERIRQQSGVSIPLARGINGCVWNLRRAYLSRPFLPRITSRLIVWFPGWTCRFSGVSAGSLYCAAKRDLALPLALLDFSASKGRIDLPFSCDFELAPPDL